MTSIRNTLALSMILALALYVFVYSNLGTDLASIIASAATTIR